MSISAKPVTVLIIDDHELFADGLKLILQQLDRPIVVSTCYQPEQILADLAQLCDYDLVLTDLQMPGLSGFGVLEAIQAQKLNVRIVVISGTEDKTEIARVMALGAQGFIPKSTPSEEILRGIDTVLDGKRYLPEELEGQIDLSVGAIKSLQRGVTEDIDTIRPRQIEVLKLMKEGHSNGQIAGILGVSESAIKSHISILFKALKVKNRTSCVREGLNKGLI